IVIGLSSPLIVPRISAWRVNWGGAFTLVGLLLDILGAVLLAWGLVMEPADEISQAPFLYTWGSAVNFWRGPFLWMALRLGGRFIAVVPGQPLAAFEDGLSGVVLLILGFLGQAVGQVTTMAVTR